MGWQKLASVLTPRGRRAGDDVPRSVSSADAVREARALVEAGRHSEALGRIDQGLAETNGDPAWVILRAEALRGWGRERDAALTIARSAHGGARLPDDWLGWAARQLGRLDEAVACYGCAHAQRPDDAAIARELARTLVACGRHDEARMLYHELEARAPDDPQFLQDAGTADLRAKRLAQAVEKFERHVRLRPDDAAAHERFGVALSLVDRTREAVEMLERSVALAARASEATAPAANLAIGYAELARWDDAARVLLDDLPRTADLAGHLQLGVALLALGRYDEGWRQYEHRWLVEPLASIRARYGVPRWSGQPLDGRTVLVRSEQGLGDVFQFIRYVPRLKGLGARVVFQPLKGMDTIARRFPGVDEIVRDGERLPPFDYYANLMSLPLAFGTTVETIPCDVPYLAPDPAYAAKWRQRFGARERPVVGLAWAGRPQHRTDRHRSLSLAQLAPVLEVAGIRFVSLQKGPAAVQAEAVGDDVDWDGVGPELDDLDDAAAILAELDLLVCVDTGLAHLAAAMGKPVWVMLPEPADYRWLVDREDTPWYPTMRLYRQSTPREWAPVVARVANDLARWRAAWTHRSPPVRDEPRAVVGLDVATPRAAAPPIAGLAAVAETRVGLLRIVPGDDPIGRSLDVAGEWMHRALAVALRSTAPGMTIVDAGADVGAHTIPLARAVGYDGALYAYESRVLHRRLLAANLALHELPHVTVMRRALGGPMPDGISAERETVDDLKLPRLDGLRLGRGVDACDIVAGAGESLWRGRPWILAEIADDASAGSLVDSLGAHGYRAWRSTLPVVDAENFNRRDADVLGGATQALLFAVPEEREIGTAPDGWHEVR